jgi:hypothetical protein
MPRRNSNPQSQQASPRLKSRGHWDRHGIDSNTLVASALLLGQLHTEFSPILYLSGGKAFRRVNICWASPEVLCILRIWETDCLVHSCRTVVPVPSEVKSEHSQTSMFGVSIFRDHPFYYCFFHFSWLVPTEWNGTTCLVRRLPLVPPPTVLICKSVRAVSPSVAVTFTAFVFYGNDFGSMTSFLLSFQKVFVFKQKTPMLHETVLFPLPTFIHNSLFINNMYVTL